MLGVWLFSRQYGTKAKRMEMYRFLREKMKEDIHPVLKGGFCAWLTYEYSIEGNSWIRKLHLLPELYKYKPFWKLTEEHWFPLTHEGFQKRIEILDKIIEKYENPLVK